MRVMVMIKSTRSSEAGEMPSQELLAAMGRYNEELVQAGIMLSGEGLHPSSRGVRVTFDGDRRIVTDGPFAETKELIAGFWMWRVQSLQEAVDWIKKCPNPMPEESIVELRPVFEAEDFGAEFTPELREQEAALRAQTLGLVAPRFVDAPARRVAGVQQHYTPSSRNHIPQQWERFVPAAGGVRHRVGSDFYGVCCNSAPACEFEYVTGVEVSSIDGLPPSLKSVELPAGRYAVFTHQGHVSAIGATIDTVWSQWAPDCGLPLSRTAPCFERYTPEFNPHTGLGGMELWVALQ
jgi:predicted transcriptional regulator YdeE